MYDNLNLNGYIYKKNQLNQMMVNNQKEIDRLSELIDLLNQTTQHDIYELEKLVSLLEQKITQDYTQLVKQLINHN